MNYIFISPQFPSNFKYFVFRLKAHGVKVFGIASDDRSQLEPELSNALDDYYRVNDMEDYGQVYQAVAYLAYRYGKPDRIESHNEYWLELDAKLRTDFNVFGLQASEMDGLRKKSEMKKVFKKIGLEVAQGETFNTLEEALHIAKKYHYPVIVKPNKGVGAAHTYQLQNEDELKQFMMYKPNLPFILEEVIEGDVLTYDGLIDTNGNLVFENSFIYDSGVMDNVVLDKDMYYIIQRSIPKDVQAVGQKTIQAYHLKERFFHMELFRKDTGTLVGLEINVRPPGGMSMDMFNFANDHDFYDTYAQLVTGQSVHVPSVKPYYVCYMGVKKNNQAKRVLTHAQVLENYASLILHHGPIASIFGPAIGDYTYILRSVDETIINEAAKAIVAQK